MIDVPDFTVAERAELAEIEQAQADVRARRKLFFARVRQRRHRDRKRMEKLNG